MRYFHPGGIKQGEIHLWHDSWDDKIHNSENKVPCHDPSDPGEAFFSPPQQRSKLLSKLGPVFILRLIQDL